MQSTRRQCTHSSRRGSALHTREHTRGPNASGDANSEGGNALDTNRCVYIYGRNSWHALFACMPACLHCTACPALHCPALCATARQGNHEPTCATALPSPVCDCPALCVTAMQASAQPSKDAAKIHGSRSGDERCLARGGQEG